MMAGDGIYLVTMIRRAGPVTGKCGKPGHSRRKATHAVPCLSGPRFKARVEYACKECALGYRGAGIGCKAYPFDVEVKQLLTASGAAGNAMAWASLCACQPGSNLAGFDAVDARVAPGEMTEGLATLGVPG